MSGAPPVVPVVRKPGRLFNERAMWVMASCPYCRRRHVHAADVVMRRLTIQAKCSRAKFYTVEEAGTVPVPAVVSR